MTRHRSRRPIHCTFAAPCLRPSKAATALIEKADLILSMDWLDLAGVFRLALGTAQTQEPADKTIVHCSVDSYRTNGWSMDHQALPAVDIPIHAEPDQFIAQMLDELDARKAPKVKTRPELKSITHWHDASSIKAAPTRGESMTLWDMAMTVREFAKKRPVTFARLPLGWPGEAYELDGPCRSWVTTAAVPLAPGRDIRSAQRWPSRAAIG